MLKNSKKTVLLTIMAAILFMMPAAPVTAAKAASGNDTIASENTVTLSCVFDAILTMVTSVSLCDEADDETACYLEAIVTMVLDVIVCTAFDTQMTCILNIILTALDDIVLCEDIGCALSTVFSMVIDIINCVETAPAAKA